MVFHTASNANGTISVTHPRFDFETNVVGTFNVAEAARKAGVKRLVYLSSASVYGRPQRFPMDEEHPRRPFVPYGASKLAGELACLSFHHSAGLPVVVGRPFCVYGRGENPKWALVEVSRFLRWHLNGLPIPIVGNVDGKTRDFVHVRDLVSGLLLERRSSRAGSTGNPQPMPATPWVETLAGSPYTAAVSGPGRSAFSFSRTALSFCRVASSCCNRMLVSRSSMVVSSFQAVGPSLRICL